MVRHSHDISFSSQFGNTPYHLDTAMPLGKHIHVWIEFLVGPLDFPERQHQAPGADYSQLNPVVSMAGVEHGNQTYDNRSNNYGDYG